MSDETWAGPSLERIDQWESAFSERAARAKSLAECTSRLSATAGDADRLAEVTVGPNVQTTDLWLDEEIRRRLASATARRDAHEALVRQSVRLAAETVGADGETGQAALAGLNGRLGFGENPP